MTLYVLLGAGLLLLACFIFVIVRQGLTGPSLVLALMGSVLVAAPVLNKFSFDGKGVSVEFSGFADKTVNVLDDLSGTVKQQQAALDNLNRRQAVLEESLARLAPATAPSAEVQKKLLQLQTEWSTTAKSTTATIDAAQPKIDSLREIAKSFRLPGR
jgi:hypothetical protein